jgi:hypothetical protein
MGDFIWTNQSTRSSTQCERALEQAYLGLSRRIHSRQGDWGIFTWAENPYPGYDTYEDESHLALFLAGPLINIPHAETKPVGNQITRTFFLHWKQQNGQVNWKQALDGPFCFVALDKLRGTLHVTTDRASFVPIYHKRDSGAEDKTAWYVSSHVGALARSAHCCHDTDPLSIVDFLFTYTVTFPYTLYKNVYQMDPGGTWIFSSEGVEKQSYFHIQDQWSQPTLPLDEATRKLREGIQNYVHRVAEGKSRIGLLLSAGSDSRVVAQMLPSHPNKHAYTFTDTHNRESQTAAQIAQLSELQHHVGLRSPSHYLDYMEGCIRLVGPQDHFYHCHTFGFRNFEGLDDCDVLFGGLFADAFLKGSHIPFSRRLKFGPKTSKKVREELRVFRGNIPTNLDQYARELLNEAKQRRLNFVESYLPDNSLCEEWETLWPASMNHNWTNFACNRRLFPSYEPFSCNRVLKVSQRASQRNKLALHLFRKAFLPELRQFHHIPHGEGHYPHRNEWGNFHIRFYKGGMNRVSKALSIPQTNHGPWPVWKEVVQLINWEQVVTDTIVPKTDFSRWNPASQLASLQLVTALRLTK